MLFVVRIITWKVRCWVTDTQTHRHTDRHTDQVLHVTLAGHAHRGLIRYKHSRSVSWAVFEVVVDPGALLTTHLYIPMLLPWTLLMVRVLVAAPYTPAGWGCKLTPFCCHRYISVPASVLAATANVTCDPQTTFHWLVGCLMIRGGSTAGRQMKIYLASIHPTSLHIYCVPPILTKTHTTL